MAGPPSSPHLPTVVVAMIDCDVIERVAALFGVRAIRVRPRRANWSTSYMARVRGAKAVAWMQALRPLMGERRREQIDRALASYEVRSTSLLDDAAVREALGLLEDGWSVRQVAERFGTSIWCIYDLRLGRTHRHLPRR